MTIRLIADFTRHDLDAPKLPAVWAIGDDNSLQQYFESSHKAGQASVPNIARTGFLSATQNCKSLRFCFDGGLILELEPDRAPVMPKGNTTEAVVPEPWREIRTFGVSFPVEVPAGYTELDVTVELDLIEVVDSFSRSAAGTVMRNPLRAGVGAFVTTSDLSDGVVNGSAGAGGAASLDPIAVATLQTAFDPAWSELGEKKPCFRLNVPRFAASPATGVRPYTGIPFDFLRPALAYPLPPGSTAPFPCNNSVHPFSLTLRLREPSRSKRPAANIRTPIGIDGMLEQTGGGTSWFFDGKSNLDPDRFKSAQGITSLLALSHIGASISLAAPETSSPRASRASARARFRRIVIAMR